MSTSKSIEEIRSTAEKRLSSALAAAGKNSSRLKIYRDFLKDVLDDIRETHRGGLGGIEVCVMRSVMMDMLINEVFRHCLKQTGAAGKTGQEYPLTLIASGGYGRGKLNPGSDIDLQFLVPESSRNLHQSVQETVNQVSLILFDLGLDVSYPVRSIKEACKFANKDHQTKTTLLDARFIAGDGNLFDNFEEAFFDNCIRGHEKSYLNERSRDIRLRHSKYGQTIHLQEPHVKEGCGGLRDYHNLVWVIWVLRKSRDLKALVQEGRLTEIAFEEIVEAYEFLMRVRNELHYSQKGRSGDILTLRLQGVIATNLKYPGKNIMRRSEKFMRD